MKHFLGAIFVVGLLIASGLAWSQVAAGTLDLQWNEGAADCQANPQAPLEVRAYNQQTFVIRENLCATFEAPFIYLLIGSQKALLIDTGDVADPSKMPLAKTVMNLLPGNGSAKLPLLVVHTHRGISTIVQAIRSSNACPTFMLLVSILIACGVTTGSPIGRMVLLK